jgi:hypothetical protein
MDFALSQDIKWTTGYRPIISPYNNRIIHESKAKEFKEIKWDKPKWFLGIVKCTPYRVYEPFQCNHIPELSEFKDYIAIVGPFKSATGCKWAATYGHDNPYFKTVGDAERLARANGLFKKRRKNVVAESHDINNMVIITID